jgi:hypothetical protein
MSLKLWLSSIFALVIEARKRLAPSFLFGPCSEPLAPLSSHGTTRSSVFGPVRFRDEIAQASSSDRLAFVSVLNCGRSDSL